MCWRSRSLALVSQRLNSFRIGGRWAVLTVAEIAMVLDEIILVGHKKATAVEGSYLLVICNLQMKDELWGIKSDRYAVYGMNNEADGHDVRKNSINSSWLSTADVARCGIGIAAIVLCLASSSLVGSVDWHHSLWHFAMVIILVRKNTCQLSMMNILRLFPLQNLTMPFLTIQWRHQQERRALDTFIMVHGNSYIKTSRNTTFGREYHRTVTILNRFYS